ncbi:hypothetical protein [Aestuariivirga sp.]|uniref:hypothetical protein n=1 Tax=Aestuariivirga sp. TaxID=2650926 RepID=UPI003919EFC4
MRVLKALLLALFVAAPPALAPVPAAAQVTEIDAQMAVSAVNGAGNRAAKVRQIKKVPSVGVIRLDMWMSPTFSNSSIPDAADFRILAQRNASGVKRLQQALQANPVTREALAKRGISPRQVAGVQVSSNGSLRLYIFRRP